MARGHKIDSVPEVPLVVSDAVESLSKTSAALALLRSVGAMPDAAKSKASKNLHKGKGKMRNRRYTQRRGPLVVYGNDLGICHAFRNIPGVELAHVERLNLLQLAPGGHMGRFCIWTKSAFAKLDSVFGTVNTESQQKKGFKVPRSMMANADLNRVINSDEIQSIVKAPKDHHARAALKKNPLKNLGAMLKLNPYAKTQRRMQILSDTRRSEAKAKAVTTARAPKAAGVKEAGKAFYSQMIVDSAYDGELCADFQSWLNKEKPADA